MSGNPDARDFRLLVTGRQPSIERKFRPKPKENQKKILFDNIDEKANTELELKSYNNATTEGAENRDPAAFGGTCGGANSGSHADEDTSGAFVYLRFRPTTEASSAFSVQANMLIVRPLLSSAGGETAPLKTSNNKNIMEKRYVFNDIFQRDIPQADVYENCVRLKIDTEENFTLLTYGTSGSGKTYTLLGTETNPGIIPRSLEHIFRRYDKNIYPLASIKLYNSRIVILEDRDLCTEIELRKTLLNDYQTNGSSTSSMDKMCAIINEEHNFNDCCGAIDNDNENTSVFIWINFIEIYNENVYDLLKATQITSASASTSTATTTSNPSTISTNLTTTTSTTMAPPPTSRRSLKIISNDGNVFVKDLTSVFVKSSAEALHLLKYGLQRVNYAATTINNNSSRSHCIFNIDLIKYSRQGDIQLISYRFCDLAGTERLQKTANVGSRLKEAQRINTSLLVLGRCLDAANTNSSNSNRQNKKNPEIIPYRESKLTMLLQTALLGKEKLTMIVNIMPTDKYYEENMNILNFASIAKNIVFKQSSSLSKKQNNKTRCSFIMEQAGTVGGNGNGGADQRNEAQLKLLNENIFLRSEIARLTKTLEIIKSENAEKLLRLEQNLRCKLTKNHRELTQKQVQAAEARFKTVLGSVERKWQDKYDSLKKKHEWEIEDLHEEMQELKESRKRRCSTVSPNDAKRLTFDIPIVIESDESESDGDVEIESSIAHNISSTTRLNNFEKSQTLDAKTKVHKEFETIDVDDDNEDDDDGGTDSSTVNTSTSSDTNDKLICENEKKSVKDDDLVIIENVVACVGQHEGALHNSVDVDDGNGNDDGQKSKPDEK